MKYFLLYILVPCLLTSLAIPVFSEKPVRLFFEKNTTVKSQPEESFTYTVQKGDSFFALLRKEGLSESQIQRLLPTIEQLNPHLKNIDHIQPGQTLILPLRPQRTLQRQPDPRTAKLGESRPKPHKPYTVRPGDTVINLFQQHGIPRPLIFSQYIPLFRQLNPNITNLDQLRAGQEVLLPLQQPQAAPAMPTSMPAPKNNLPDPQTLAINAQATQKNSAPKQIHNTSKATAPGRTTSEPWGTTGPALPFLSKIQSPAPIPKTPLAILPANTDQENHAPEVDQPRTGLPYLREILQAMRCTFAKGDEELYPLPGGGWLQIKLQETPVLTMPWGRKVILCPTPKNDAWIKQATQLGIQVCTVPADWSLDGVLGSLADTFPNQIRLWPTEQDLSLSSKGLGLTVKTPRTVIIQHQGQKLVYALWHRPDPDSPALPQGLAEVLSAAHVKIIETNHLSEISRLPSRPRESIYLPMAEHMELIRALNPDNPQELFGATLPQSLDALLRLLKSKDMLHSGVANLTWSGHQDRRIKIQVPAWNVGALSNKIILVDKKFADEYLISLLAQEGYSCFVLPD